MTRSDQYSPKYKLKIPNCSNTIITLSHKTLDGMCTICAIVINCMRKINSPFYLSSTETKCPDRVAKIY